jgi:ketosteroid isomerase-like protein
MGQGGRVGRLPVGLRRQGLAVVSGADIETLRDGYEAFSRGDWDWAFREAPPDFELRTADRVTSPGTYLGPEEARRFFEDLFEPFEEIVVEPQQFFERGDRILAFVLVRSRPRGSSAVVENRIAHVWTMRDGKAICLQIFPERERALEAVGLSEQDISS